MISRFNFREKKLILFLIALIILLLTIFLQGKFIQKISDSRVNLNNEIENFWQTENLYTAILYEKRPEENYFKIKAIAKNNSSNMDRAKTSSY